MTSSDVLHAAPGRISPDRGWIARALYRLQLARMTSVLSQMDDKVLAHIGITRDEIPAHAERLLREG